jgi:hypothetical protein
VFAETDEYSPISIHLWGAIDVGFKSPLVFFEENVNSDVYVNSLKGSEFVELADMAFWQRQWCLGQDGASCHTSTCSLNALFEVCNVFPEGRRILQTSLRLKPSGERSKGACSGKEFRHWSKPFR